MFIAKKHIPRRTFLRGAGVTLALPLLDAMVPAATLLAQTAATPKPRFIASVRAARHVARILGAGQGRNAASRCRRSSSRWNRTGSRP